MVDWVDWGEGGSGEEGEKRRGGEGEGGRFVSRTSRRVARGPLDGGCACRRYAHSRCCGLTGKLTHLFRQSTSHPPAPHSLGRPKNRQTRRLHD